MKNGVSKVRTQKTRDREKQARGAASSALPFRERPAVGFLLASALWVATVIVLNFEHLLTRRAGPAFLLPLAGNATFLLVSLFAAGLFLKILKPHTLSRNSRILLLALISLTAVLSAKVLVYATETTGWARMDVLVFLLPVAMSPLLATILIGSVAGIAAGVWSSLAIATLVSPNFLIMITGIVATMVAAQLGRNVRTRARVFKTGLLVGLAQIACVFGFTALNWQTSDIALVFRQSAACLASGVVSAAIVLVILPLFETTFKITTDITLLELSDLGHPLLQRLALEAPGTYHHSLVVASVAQAAADEIGANGLLTRVCAYFHDIGKLTKPDFFSENIQLQTNPHDELPPSMSTLVITSHVKEGLTLAMLHKLPQPILDVIREHHGTSLVSFFHNKAKERFESEREVEPASPVGATQINESDFRYPGPRPRNRESGIIALADAVEAASRSLKKVTPNHIEDLVNEIVGRRIRDGQLDDCELSLHELTSVRRSFVFTLKNMLHGRVPYPQDEDRDKQPTERPKAGPKDAHDAGKVPDGPRSSPDA